MSDNQLTPQYDKPQKKTPKIDNELPSKKVKSSKIKHPSQALKHMHNPNRKYPSTITPQSISLSILQKHSSTPVDYSQHIVDNLIDSANNHFIAVFKDHMIMDYIDEFLKRAYKSRESLERIPKFANYYKNYLQFFCKPMFSDLNINELIQQYGEATAKVYYNQNYGKQKKKQKAFVNDKLKTIFSLTVKEGIEQNSSLDISKPGNESISLTENSLLFNKESQVNAFGYEESLISLLDNFQQKASPKKRFERNVPLPFSLNKAIVKDNQGCSLAKKSIPFTERVNTSKDRLKGKESNENLRTLPSNIYTSNHHLSRNINYNNSNNLNAAKTVNSRNKPIKLTTGPSFHMKTASVQLQAQKDNYIKNAPNMVFQSKLSSDSLVNSHKTQAQSKKTFASTQRNFSSNLNPAGTLNLNDVMKLTLQLYYPSTKRNVKSPIQHQNPHQSLPNQQINNRTQTNHLHHHTLSSPTINNFNININNHICLNEAKSPKVIRNYNSNSNLNLNVNSNEANSTRKKQQTIADELKKNININFDLKNLMIKSKALSRNKPQSLTKTKTVEVKGQPNSINRNSLNFNQNRLFTSFSIFDLQQQLLNSKAINQMNAKHTIGNHLQSNEHLSSNQQQSLSQTKQRTNKQQPLKPQAMKNKGASSTRQGNSRLSNKKI